MIGFSKFLVVLVYLGVVVSSMGKQLKDDARSVRRRQLAAMNQRKEKAAKVLKRKAQRTEDKRLSKKKIRKLEQQLAAAEA